MSKKRGKMPILASAGFAAWGVNGYQGYRNGGINSALGDMTGYDVGNHKLDLSRAVWALTPPVLGLVGSKVASMSGINRMVPRWVPFKL